MPLHCGFSEQIVEVEGVCEHRDGALGGAGPLLAGAVPIEFHAVVVGVAEVECFADAVIGGAFQRDVRFKEVAEGVRRVPRGTDKGLRCDRARCCLRAGANRRRFPRC